VEKNRWGVFNSCMKGDEEGEFTFTEGRGNLTIDFVLDEKIREEIEDMRIGDRIDLDHHPVEVRVKKKEKNNREKKEGVEECIRWGGSR